MVDAVVIEPDGNGFVWRHFAFEDGKLMFETVYTFPKVGHTGDYAVAWIPYPIAALVRPNNLLFFIGVDGALICRL